jgi:hypothetical protein
MFCGMMGVGSGLCGCILMIRVELWGGEGGGGDE